MECRRCPSEILAYLGSFWRRVREQNTKTAQRLEHAYAEIPAELAGGWMPTESGTGRLATGGKAFAGTTGKMRPTSAPADMHREKQKCYPSSIWSDLTEAHDNGFLSNNVKRPLPSGNTPKPNQTFLRKLLAIKSTLQSSEGHTDFKNFVSPISTSIPKSKLNRFGYADSRELPFTLTEKNSNKKKTKKAVSKELALIPAGNRALAQKTKSILGRHPTNSIGTVKYQRYQDEDQDLLPSFAMNSTASSMLDIRK